MDLDFLSGPIITARFSILSWIKVATAISKATSSPVAPKIYTHYGLQRSQIPFTSIFMSSGINLSGRLICGIRCSVKQIVLLHLVQWKCKCRSECFTKPSSWSQSAYFGIPVPSSIWWTMHFSSKVFKVLYRVVLSDFSKFSSTILRLTAEFWETINRCTKMRMAVGLIPNLFNCFSVSSTISGYIHYYCYWKIDSWGGLVAIILPNIGNHMFYCSKLHISWKLNGLFGANIKNYSWRVSSILKKVSSDHVGNCTSSL